MPAIGPCRSCGLPGQGASTWCSRCITALLKMRWRPGDVDAGPAAMAAQNTMVGHAQAVKPPRVEHHGDVLRRRVHHVLHPAVAQVRGEAHFLHAGAPCGSATATLVAVQLAARGEPLDEVGGGERKMSNAPSRAWRPVALNWSRLVPKRSSPLVGLVPKMTVVQKPCWSSQKSEGQEASLTTRPRLEDVVPGPGAEGDLCPDVVGEVASTSEGSRGNVYGRQLNYETNAGKGVPRSRSGAAPPGESGSFGPRPVVVPHRGSRAPRAARRRCGRCARPSGRR